MFDSPQDARPATSWMVKTWLEGGSRHALAAGPRGHSRSARSSVNAEMRACSGVGLRLVPAFSQVVTVLGLAATGCGAAPAADRGKVPGVDASTAAGKLAVCSDLQDVT